MSGRDLRNFVTSHRADNTTALVTRVTDGFYSSKYKQVDYDQLKALAAQKKSHGQEKLAKVQKLQKASKQSKEQQLLCQHRGVWRKELTHLKAQQKQASNDLTTHISQNCPDTAHIYTELMTYDDQLERDRDVFRQATTPAIYELASDLRYWVEQASKGFPNGDVEQDPTAVKGSLDAVKEQHTNLLQKLEHERMALEEELVAGELSGIHLSRSSLTQEKLPETGIPDAAYYFKCPDMDFKANMLMEFILVDHRYVMRLEDLEKQHRSAIESPTGGWSEEDHDVFLYVLNQYTHDVKDRRLLYIDRMRRHLTHMTRAQIVSHEEWWMLYRSYHQRRKDLISDWQRDREELLNRTIVVFDQAVAADAERKAKKQDLAEQRRYCDQLYKQVSDWQANKQEIQRLQQTAEDARRQAYEETARAQRDHDNAKRSHDKRKIAAFHEAQEAERRHLEDKQQRRLEALQEQLQEQAAYDCERVLFRQDEARKKAELLQKQEEERLAEEEEKQRTLEKLREKVRPQVDADLMRLWSDTKAWHTRVYGNTDAHDDAEVNIQRPLFELNTFSANKIAEDPRFRFAERLQAAGITQNPYAREAYSKLQPLQQPRRDMESTVFKMDAR